MNRAARKDRQLKQCIKVDRIDGRQAAVKIVHADFKSSTGWSLVYWCFVQYTVVHACCDVLICLRDEDYRK